MLEKKHGSPKANGASDRFQTIYEQLRDRICLLEYHPGTRLSEEQLAQEFGVSRTPIRRVLGRLEAQGLVQIRQGVGNFVTDLEHGELVQCYELRLELTGLLSRLPTREDVKSLAAEFRDVSRRGEQIRDGMNVMEFSRLNAEYYGLILRLSRNEPLKEISENLYFVTTRNWVSSIPQMDFSEEVDEFLREMRQVADAMMEGDIVAACQFHGSFLSLSYRRILNRAN